MNAGHHRKGLGVKLIPVVGWDSSSRHKTDSSCDVLLCQGVEVESALQCKCHPACSAGLRGTSRITVAGTGAFRGWGARRCPPLGLQAVGGLFRAPRRRRDGEIVIVWKNRGARDHRRRQCCDDIQETKDIKKQSIVLSCDDDRLLACSTTARLSASSRCARR